MAFREIAVITGASSGIGFEICRQLTSMGYLPILISKDSTRLHEAGRRISAEYNIQPYLLNANLENPEELKNLQIMLDKHQDSIKVFVNAAGFGLGGEFKSNNIFEELKLIDVNVKSLVFLTHYAANIFKKNGGGFILNVASLAGFQPGPFYANYYATKAYVLHFSEAISHELRPHNIYCTTLCPGANATDFHNRAGSEKTGLSKGLFGIVDDAQIVAKKAVNALFARRPLIIPGLVNKMAAFSIRLAPRSLVLFITSKINT